LQPPVACGPAMPAVHLSRRDSAGNNPPTAQWGKCWLRPCCGISPPGAFPPDGVSLPLQCGIRQAPQGQTSQSGIGVAVNTPSHAAPKLDISIASVKYPSSILCCVNTRTGLYSSDRVECCAPCCPDGRGRQSIQSGRGEPAAVARRTTRFYRFDRVDRRSAEHRTSAVLGDRVSRLEKLKQLALRMRAHRSWARARGLHQAGAHALRFTPRPCPRRAARSSSLPPFLSSLHSPCRMQSPPHGKGWSRPLPRGARQ